ncbi:hypothetical protein EDD16DRAFT_1043555 [Pisolithus croceorrhizus]|nr:hypothetical protein EDD16DRAFT_1043555 [Pisolithus croceorrhizus]
MDLTDEVSDKRAELEGCRPGHDSRDVALGDLAVALHNRFKAEGKVDDVDEAITLHRAALELRPSGHPEQSSSLLGLARCLSSRYGNQGVVADLEEAVTLSREALALCPPDHLSHGASLNSLARNLRRRFEKYTTMHDLDEAFELHRSALELHPSGHPEWSSSLHGLAVCFLNRYNNQGVVADLKEAVTLCREELAHYPPGHPSRGVSLKTLAYGLLAKFWEQATVHDLDEAFELSRTALELHPSGHPERYLSLCGLALCFSSRYNNLGVVADLEEVITLYREALGICPPGHPDRCVSLNNLGVNLQKRFKKHSTMLDLDEAFELHRAVSELYPPGHPEQFFSLHGLGRCFSSRYDKLRAIVDLEEAITLGRAALVLHPPGHRHRSTCLYNLGFNLWTRFWRQASISGSGRAKFVRRAALVLRPINDARAAFSFHALSLHFWDKFQNQPAIADLDEAISLATYALELRLLNHGDYSASTGKLALFIRERVQWFVQGRSPNESAVLGQAVDSLCALEHYLRDRFRKQHAVADLVEAITLHKYVLQLRPAGHPSHPSNIHDLKLCLIEKFHDTAAVGDSDVAIALERKTPDLSVPGDPSYDVSKDCLATYLRIKISPQLMRASSIRSVATEYEVSQVVRHVVSEILETMPTRLLNTQTGVLCDRDAQISHFTSSQQHKQLLSSAMLYDPVERVGRIHTVVSACFRFAMFSHRWGEGEPSLRDVQGRAIYDMPPSSGVDKLQKFCLAAFKQGYQWAWSDTCCIDKDSSTELQEAIGSMFGWYRRSALTIVYLSDVPETGSFAASQWFGRGWTLQELLAPATVLFYTRNWSLYRNIESSNHKADSTILEEIAKATGIASRFLTDFTPGMDDARLRLQWASSCRTTRPEDVAYSLFGIFDVHLPVLYGESAEFALGRLLAEVISQSGDISILDWIGEVSTFHSCFPARITSYRTLPLPSVRRRRTVIYNKSTTWVVQCAAKILSLTQRVAPATICKPTPHIAMFFLSCYSGRAEQCRFILTELPYI